jgi:hypothetical protein
MAPPLPPISMPVPFGARMHGQPHNSNVGYSSAPSMDEASPLGAATASGYYSHGGAHGAGGAVWSGKGYSSSPREVFGSPGGSTRGVLGYSPAGVMPSNEYGMMQSEVRRRSGEEARALSSSSWEALGGGEAGGPSGWNAAVVWPALNGNGDRNGNGGGGGGVWGAVPAP